MVIGAVLFGWLTWSTSAPFQGGSLHGCGPIRSVMVSRRLSAWRRSLLGPSCARCGVALLLRGAYRAGRAWTASGLPRSTPVRCARGGCPLYSRAVVSAHASSGADVSWPVSLSWLSIIPAISPDGASSRIHLRSPVRSCRSLGGPDGTARPWALPLASHRSLPIECVGIRHKQRILAWVADCSSSTHLVQPRVAPTTRDYISIS